MSAETGRNLAASIRAAFAELKALCAGLDEETADKAPAGRWSPREILSHLMGPEGGGAQALFLRFLSEDTPRIDIVPEQTYMDGPRKDMPFARMLGEAEAKYEALAGFALSLSEAQLARRAHIPLFKDSPLTDHPTLAAFLGGLGEYHVRVHLDHLRQVLAEQKG